MQIVGCRARAPVRVPQSGTAGLATLSRNELAELPKVHPLKLDGSEFLIQNLRVATKTYIKYRTPVLFFEYPEIASSVQIIRCLSDVLVDGGEGFVEKGLFQTDLQERLLFFQRNDIWFSLTNQNGCELIANSLHDDVFPDMTAPSGKYHYYIRACILPARLLKDESVPMDRVCSRQVGRSGEYVHENSRSQTLIEASARSQQLRNEIDSVSEQIMLYTEKLNKTLFGCGERHNQAVAKQEEKDKTAELFAIGTGVGIGAAAASYGLGKGLDNKYRKKIGFWGSTPEGQRAKKLVKAGGASVLLAGSAAYIAYSINKLSGDAPSSYPKDAQSCYGPYEEELAKNLLLREDLELMQSPCNCSEALLIKQKLRILSSVLELKTALWEVENVRMGKTPEIIEMEVSKALDSAEVTTQAVDEGNSDEL